MFDDPIHIVLLFVYGAFVSISASELKGRGWWHWIAGILFGTGLLLIVPVIVWMAVIGSGSLSIEWLMWMLEWRAIPSALSYGGVIIAAAGVLLFIAADTVLCWRGRRKLFPFMYASRE